GAEDALVAVDDHRPDPRILADGMGRAGQLPHHLDGQQVHRRTGDAQYRDPASGVAVQLVHGHEFGHGWQPTGWAPDLSFARGALQLALIGEVVEVAGAVGEAERL